MHWRQLNNSLLSKTTFWSLEKHNKRTRFLIGGGFVFRIAPWQMKLNTATMLVHFSPRQRYISIATHLRDFQCILLYLINLLFFNSILDRRYFIILCKCAFYISKRITWFINPFDYKRSLGYLSVFLYFYWYVFTTF